MGAGLGNAVNDFLNRSSSVDGCVVYRIDEQGEHEACAGGVADRRSGRAMTVDATFRIASCTKTFTAATALRLAEAGRLSIDDPIAIVFDDAIQERLKLGNITWAHLLQHTSGLPDMDGQTFMDELYKHPAKAWTPWEKIERSIVGRPRIGLPGPPARYSDVGYIVTAMAIEAVTGEPLHSTFRRYLRFAELCLDVIHLEWLEEAPAHAGPRVRHFVGERDVTDIHPSCDLWGAGGLVSDAHDLAVWWHALFGGEVFEQPASLYAMLRVVPEPDAARDMGLGIYRRIVNDQAIWMHGGWWGAYPLHNQTTGTTAVVLLTQCLDHAGPAFRDFVLGLVVRQ